MTLTSKDKLLLFLQATCGGFLFNVLILYGMKTTSVTNAGIISSITPIMIFILAATLLHEKINFQKGLAIVIVMIGLVILNTGKTSVPACMASYLFMGSLAVSCFFFFGIVD